jgi:cell division inhibitor SepF
MSALRKAGVWLGLVEEDDDRHDDGLFDEDFAEDEDDYAAPARTRSLARPRAAERDRDTRDRDTRDRDGRDLRERDRDHRDREPLDRDLRSELRGGGPFDRPPRLTEPDPRAPDRATDRHSDRTSDRGADVRGSVRQLARPTTSSSISFPTQDNLALAPQVQLSERAVVGEEKTRRVQITTLHPTSYNEARTIGEHFRDGVPVIMNLTEMDEADAKRLVDFGAGLAFGLRGSMERVTNRVFLLSPPNIQVSAEDKARIAQVGFFDQG